MDGSTTVLLATMFFGATMLYSLVGYAGASGYLAAMAFVGLAPSIMRPTALALNILVAAIASFKVFRVGCFSWRLFWPFTVLAIPAAYIGGSLTVPSHLYRVAVAVVLLYSFDQAMWPARSQISFRRPPVWLALLCGGVIGLVSGLIGVGGGIFLSPLILLMRWGETRETSSVSALFILLVSIAGLLGNSAHVTRLPNAIILCAGVAIVGGLIGLAYGSRRLPPPELGRLLAVGLLVVGLRMILT
jgi:uncharacterized protein